MISSLPHDRVALHRDSNTFQIRPIVDLLSPLRAAIEARDQCVAFFGVDSNMAHHHILDLARR